MDQKKRIGQYLKCSVSTEHYTAYVPKNLPPDPPLDMSQFYSLLDQANIAIGRLDGLSVVLPDPSLFLYMYIRKEAVLSSQIEGTQSSLSDLLLFENEKAPGVPVDDVAEVSNYVAAMNYGLERLKEFPLSLRLLRELHGILLSGGRGSHKLPGEFRTSQNWIGGTRPGNALFVPPPPDRLGETLGAFEKFLHNDKTKFLHNDKTKLPALVKAALAHVQFETIHPFLDGNGRLGRLLITFILCVEGVLKEPMLYLSLYFKTNRQTYYEHLQQVRTKGNWEEWIKFFLTGVIRTANQATETAQTILKLFNEDRKRIETAGKSPPSVLAIHHYFQHSPISNTSRIKERCKVSLPTVLRSLSILAEKGIVKEITHKSRHKTYVYQKYLDILNQEDGPD